MGKTALITGITGQDGSYLAEWLLEHGYEVHGTVRGAALDDPLHRMWRIAHVKEHLQLHAVELEDHVSVLQLLKQVRPDEIYHLAAHSVVGCSPEDEFSILRTNITTTHAMLSGFRIACPAARWYFAASSEMFGNASEMPQKETTPFNPRSAYGISKRTGFDLTRYYREAYRLFAVSGIFFNHESPRRGFEFVSRKISSHVALIAAGKARTLRLGNLEATRDWGHAKKYIEAVWRMLQTTVPEDLVIATGQTHRVRDWCEIAFRLVGREYHDYVETDATLRHPTEETVLVGDASKARSTLGWSYDLSFEELVQEMVEADVERVQRGEGEWLSAAVGSSGVGRGC